MLVGGLTYLTCDTDRLRIQFRKRYNLPACLGCVVLLWEMRGFRLCSTGRVAATVNLTSGGRRSFVCWSCGHQAGHELTRFLLGFMEFLLGKLVFRYEILKEILKVHYKYFTYYATFDSPPIFLSKLSKHFNFVHSWFNISTYVDLYLNDLESSIILEHAVKILGFD